MSISLRSFGQLCGVLILFVLAVSGRALAQKQTVVKPETVGLSSERLDRIGKAI